MNRPAFADLRSVASAATSKVHEAMRHFPQELHILDAGFAGHQVDDLNAARDRFNAALDRMIEFVESEIEAAFAPPFPPYGSIDRPIPYVPVIQRGGVEIQLRGTTAAPQPVSYVDRGPEFDQSEIGGEG